ncbi:MAG TPA: universal stress protein [Solirubrobacteraceae bacterium]|nr:universal stress protein [Solirubrobacteraceae bacterium]
MRDRPFSYRALFAVVYTASVSSVYFALGVVARHANGLTPAVFLVAGLFFGLTAMTYAEGASLHPERGGSAVFARYAFNELVSFVAGWAIFLDYTILIAVTALTVPSYLAAFAAPIGKGALEIAVAFTVIALVAVDNLTGVSARRLRTRVLFTGGDLILQALIIVLGFVLVFDPSHLTASINLGTAPRWSDLAFALPIAVIAFTGIEAAASIAGEVSATRRQVKSIVGPGSALIVLIYVGISLVGVGALPVHDGLTALGTTHIKAPVLGVVEAFHPRWLADVLKYAVAIGGALALFGAAGSAMLGVSRVGYSLATNRQIPSAVGRLHGRWGTPYVIIGVAAIAAAGLVLPRDLEFLVGIYAFGALLAFTIAHVSVIALRFREPGRDRPYSVPMSMTISGASVPLPAVAGAVASAFGWVALLVFHAGARYVGLSWLLSGLLLYVAYRKSQQKPLLRRVTIPERALRYETLEPEFGSILVPILGTALDDDIVQTAGRLAGETRDDLESEGAMIEAIWVFEIPLALPMDAPLPDAQVKRAREALARAKLVGEEYEGVEVATAIVRARRAGEAIVREACRRGVEAIVLAAEESSRVRGGALLGGRGGPLENYVGDVSRYVIGKAPCRVILTAPPADWRAKTPSQVQPAPSDVEQQTAAADGGPAAGGADTQAFSHVDDRPDG